MVVVVCLTHGCMPARPAVLFDSAASKARPAAIFDPIPGTAMSFARADWPSAARVAADEDAWYVATHDQQGAWRDQYSRVFHGTRRSSVR